MQIQITIDLAKISLTDLTAINDIILASGGKSGITALEKPAFDKKTGQQFGSITLNAEIASAIKILQYLNDRAEAQS
jgi:hypothetical protein